jgi:hypothetical protein
MRWRTGVGRADVLGVSTSADAGDPQQSAISAPATRKAHEHCRSRIVQSVLLAGTGDKVAFHPQDAPAGDASVTPSGPKRLSSGSRRFMLRLGLRDPSRRRFGSHRLNLSGRLRQPQLGVSSVQPCRRDRNGGS